MFLKDYCTNLAFISSDLILSCYLFLYFHCKLLTPEVVGDYSGDDWGAGRKY